MCGTTDSTPVAADEHTTSGEHEELSSEVKTKPLPRCYPKWRGEPVYAGNPEALAWTIVSIGMSMQYVGAGAFLATAILRVAEDAYICRLDLANSTDVNLTEECGPGVGSMNPGSLLTAYALVVGLIAAILLPFIGAVIDYTRHRLLIGRIVSVLYTILLFPLMFLTDDNYIAILICHGCSVFVGWFVTSLQYSYLPELTNSELQLAEWTKWITIWTFFGMIIYLSCVIMTVILVGRVGDDIFSNRVGMATSFACNFVIMGSSWWVLFDKRDPLHERPENSSLWSLGFTQLYDTSCHIARNYRGLKWFFIHISFSDAGWQSFGIFLLTYFTDFMRMVSIQTGIAFIIVLVGSIPGAAISTYVARRTDPLTSTKINMVLMMIVIVVFVSVLTEPGQTKRAYIVALFIGLCGGWKYSMDRLIGSSLIPIGQDTEMMGVFLFAGQCMLWLPLLVYTIMNEAEISPRISVSVLIVYIACALFAVCMVGDYTDARAEVKRESVYLKKEQTSSSFGGEEDAGSVSKSEDLACAESAELEA